MFRRSREPTIADSPGRHGLAEGHSSVAGGRGLVLLGLVALCFLPRAIMAWKLTGICPDAVLYIQTAEALEKGLFAEAFQRIQLNVLPVVLMLLHRGGLPWEVAGTWWGVLISSCTVLPLYGWVRRQFDDRVALTACFLYAIHSDLIRWSPEILRDPTFWFLFTLALYLLWRAVTEVRGMFFLAAGLAMALAALTRFEGLLLLMPLVLWSFWCGGTRRGSESAAREISTAEHGLRWRLVAGSVLCVSVGPLLVTLVSVFWVRTHTPWQLVRTDPARLAREWVNAGWTTSSMPGGLEGPLSGEVLEQRSETPGIAVNGREELQPARCQSPFPRNPGSSASLPLVRMIDLFVAAMIKGLTPVFLLLLLGGVIAEWPLWKRREHQVLFCASLTVLLQIWIHLWSSHTACQRYFFPIVIMASPFAALGLLRFSAAAARLTQGVANKAAGILRVPSASVLFRFSGRHTSHAGMVPGACCCSCGSRLSAVPAMLLVLLSLTQVLARDCAFRRASVDLGHWIRQQYGPARSLFGPDGVTQVVNYYAQGQCQSFSTADVDSTIVAYVGQARPDVVLLPADRKFPDHGADLVRQIEDFGFVQVGRSQFGDRCRKVLVLTRS